MKKLAAFAVVVATCALMSPVAAAPPPSVKIAWELASSCGTLPPTQSCIGLWVTVKNYPANPFSWTLYSRAKRNAPDVYITDAIVGVNTTGNLTFFIGGTVCDASRPWWNFTITSPDTIRSNSLKVC